MEWERGVEIKVNMRADRYGRLAVSRSTYVEGACAVTHLGTGYSVVDRISRERAQSLAELLEGDPKFGPMLDATTVADAQKAGREAGIREVLINYRPREELNFDELDELEE